MSPKHDSSNARSVSTLGATTAELLARPVLQVLVKPNSSNTEILGMRDGYLHIGLRAPAQEGRANEELLRFLNKYTGKQYRIISGIASKRKLLKTS